MCEANCCIMGHKNDTTFQKFIYCPICGKNLNENLNENSNESLENIIDYSYKTTKDKGCFSINCQIFDETFLYNFVVDREKIQWSTNLVKLISLLINKNYISKNLTTVSCINILRTDTERCIDHLAKNFLDWINKFKKFTDCGIKIYVFPTDLYYIHGFKTIEDLKKKYSHAFTVLTKLEKFIENNIEYEIDINGLKLYILNKKIMTFLKHTTSLHHSANFKYIYPILHEYCEDLKEAEDLFIHMLELK